MNQEYIKRLSVLKKNRMILGVLVLTMIFTLSPTSMCKVFAKVKLNQSSATMAVGKTLQLKTKGTKKKLRVTWKSSNKKVAAVSKKGKITAKKAGKATITAKIRGKGIRVTRKVKVTVITKPAFYRKNKEKLYKYIVKHGIYDKHENAYYLYKKVYDEGDGDGPVIFVNVQALKNTKTIRYTVYLSSNTPDDNYEVYMTMKYNEYKPGVLYYKGYPMDYSPDTLEMNGSINYSYNGKNNGIKWTHQSLYDDNEGTTSESDTVNKQYIERANYLIGYGFKGWNALSKKAGVTMKDIGFVKY